MTNTAAEKVDWLVSQILSKLVEFVPSNIRNTKELTDLLDNLNNDTPSFEPNATFISLDAVNLYSSIPLDFGIKKVVDFAEQHWLKICLLYTSPSPRDLSTSRMPSSA